MRLAVGGFAPCAGPVGARIGASAETLTLFHSDNHTHLYSDVKQHGEEGSSPVRQAWTQGRSARTHGAIAKLSTDCRCRAGEFWNGENLEGKLLYGHISVYLPRCLITCKAAGIAARFTGMRPSRDRPLFEASPSAVCTIGGRKPVENLLCPL